MDTESTLPLNEQKPLGKLKSYKRAGITFFVFVAAIFLSAWLMMPKVEEEVEPLVDKSGWRLWNIFYYCKDKKFCVRFRAMEEERV